MLLNAKMSRHVTFHDQLPSETEFFEEYSKFSGCHFWFVVVYILRTFVPFCLALQTDGMDFPSTINNLFQRFANQSNSYTAFLYEARCLERPSAGKYRASFVEYCAKQRFIVEMNICKNIGFSIGGILGGPLADIYGRRIIGLIFSISWALLSWISVFMPNFGSTKICFIAVSSFCGCVNVVTFVNFAEIATKKNRIFSIYTLPGFVVGNFWLGYVVSKIPQLNLVQICVAWSIFIVIFGCWYTPESPRWLWNKNKQEQAYRQLQDISGCRYLSNLENLPKTQTRNGEVILQMFMFLVRQKWKVFLIICYLSTISGLFFSCSKWNLVLSFVQKKQHQYLMALAEIAGFIFYIPLYLFLGKRFSLFFIYVLMTIQSLTGIIEPVGHTEVYANAFGTLLGVASVSAIWLYMLEIFPTFIRATVTGISFGAFGIATITGIIIVDSRETVYSVHQNVVLLIMALFAGVVYFLPAPLKHELPNQKLF